MAQLMFSEIAEYLGANLIGKDAPFTGMAVDTRNLKPQELFVALKGQKFDGHYFIKEAEKKGAGGFIVSSYIKTNKPVIQVVNTKIALGKIAQLYRSRFTIPIVAITGSSGKTTFKEMLSSILRKVGPVLATAGNLNNEIGLPLTLSQLKPQHKFAVIEMGARQLNDIHYLMNITNPTHSVITNVGSAHIEIFGNIENIAQTKGEIYQYLDKKGTAFINNDESFAPFWKSLLQGQSLITFGIKNESDMTIHSIQMNARGSDFTLVDAQGSQTIHLKAPGEHNVVNALGAATIARKLGVDYLTIKNGLENFETIEGRLQFKEGIYQALIIDDTYNANPDSMRAGLRVLAKNKVYKIFVMGDMLELGMDAVSQHAEIGAFAKDQGIDQLLAYGQLSLYAVESFGENGLHFEDKRSLLEHLKAQLDNNTCVLVKGSRGMKMEDVVNELVTA
ncbi:MAG: UDP-N-acetylmuramoylalanyl-D-glutamyl-2,6-diaminopimelate--D-alanyl-D-alanyl ligase [Francisellaceae bacterium]|nr:UDP-N-acetylmuramoylalanyl-D-glutamyl-2,6-diaminopimelate--D-alanyl-D-alanyl ligase [Francisellaceae bacterium]